MSKKQILFYVIVAMVVAFGINAIAYAGDAQIKNVTFDGSCVKMWVSSNEDDSSDRFMIKFQVRTSKGRQWGSQKSWRGLTTRTKYLEFCNSNFLRPQHCHVNSQIFHNGKLEDQHTWGSSR